MQAQPLPHAHAHTDGPKHTYLQSVKNVEVCFHCPVWLTEREDPALFRLGTYKCIYLATLHYLKYLTYCTLNYSPSGYFYVKCTLLTIMSYDLVEKDNFLCPCHNTCLLFKLNEISNNSRTIHKFT